MRFAILLLPLMVAACAETGTLKTTFDPSEAAFSQMPGTSEVTGQGFLRQSGGGVVTCAGLAAVLIPSTTHSRERMQVMYGSTVQGFRRVIPGINMPEDATYMKTVRQTQCDSKGNFRFSDVPTGTYFAATLVRWETPTLVGSVTEGGFIMKRVTVEEGKKPDEVLLTF